MSVSILLMTHEGIGQAFIRAVKVALARPLPLKISYVEFFDPIDVDKLTEELLQAIKTFDQGDGILIITDIYGATPCNIAKRLMQHEQVRVITGLNLPMLLRVMNYPDLKLVDMAQKAIAGAQAGIIQCLVEQNANDPN
jgi:PTS system ascorbate-specific IIA component